MRAGEAVEELHHLNWNGRVSWPWYAVRRLFVAPAPNMDRCIMGYPVGEHVRCPRRSVVGELWCRRHLPRRAAVSGEEG